MRQKTQFSKLLQQQQGLTIPEFLLFLAILSVLVGAFAPGAMKKQILTNEALAVNGVKALFNASAAYFSNEEIQTFPDSISSLMEGAAYRLPKDLQKGLMNGYVFSIKLEPGDGYRMGFSIEAHPLIYRQDGVRSFYMDESGQLRGEDAGGFPGSVSMPHLTVANKP